jgi:hypothetical protein
MVHLIRARFARKECVMKKTCGFSFFCLVLCLAAARSRETVFAAPWDNLLTFSRVEADPNKEYRLTENNGPWMILACSFSGENARTQAHDLVIEFRRRYKLPAYMYEKKFEFGKHVRGRGIDRYGDALRMEYQRGSEVNEIAVMVGDYQTIDDPAAQATLERIKYYRPECLELDAGKPTARNLAGLRTIQKMLLKSGNEKKNKGPMSKAFVTTNPLLPRDYFAPNGLDQFVVKLNAGNRYSLLDCPGRYTVQVAHFKGDVVLVDQGRIRDIEEGRRRLNGKLAEAAEKAERLTQALRMKDYEAYVFHDRYASIVTVGSFDSVGTPRPDGRIEINPGIHKIMTTFGVSQESAINPTGAIATKQLVGIPFDPQPVPVEVPKRSMTSDYARREVAWR